MWNNWKKIIATNNYIIKKDFNYGFNNKLQIAKIENKFYLLSKPIKNSKQLNYLKNKEIYKKLNNFSFIRKTFYYDYDISFYKYYQNYEILNQNYNLNKLVTVIKKMQKINLDVDYVNWFYQILDYQKIATQNNFDFKEKDLNLVITIFNYLKKQEIKDEIVFSHGDLTPDNILVNNFKKFIIIDFEYCCKTYKMWDLVYFCHYNNFSDEKSYKFIQKFYVLDIITLYHNIKLLVILVSCLWAAQDYSLTKNKNSLKQYNQEIKKLKERSVKICTM